MIGETIKRERLNRGWTQSELGKHVGISQSAVSFIERGRFGPPKIIEKIIKVLEIDSSTFQRKRIWLSEKIEWKVPQEILSLPLLIQKWQRPDQSGDSFMALPILKDSALIVAIDVAGSKPRSILESIYLQGWLHGLINTLTLAPRIENLVEKLQFELERTNIEAAWFIALVTKSYSKLSSISYYANSYLYPTPLLIVGSPHNTLPSTKEIMWSTENKFGIRPLTHEELIPPWRLVIASDGLLQRLGAGEEEKGKRTLLRWQTGFSRDEPLSKFLNVRQQEKDDEMCVTLIWNGWDIEYEFYISNNHERHRVLDDIKSKINKSCGPHAAEKIGIALGEAFKNIMSHAYGNDGPAVARFRDEGERCRVEVVDEGINGTFEEGDGFKLMRKNTDDLDIKRNYPKGIVISFVVNKEL